MGWRAKQPVHRAVKPMWVSAWRFSPLDRRPAKGLNQNLYYRWSKEFLEAGKKRLAGDTVREATSDEVKVLRQEAVNLKEAVAELLMENRLLKKDVIGDGEDNILDIQPLKVEPGIKDRRWPPQESSTAKPPRILLGPDISSHREFMPIAAGLHSITK